MRTTGSDVTTTTLGESVRAFVPHALPSATPALVPAPFEAAVPDAERVMTGQKKNRSFSHAAYVALLGEGS